MIRTAFRILICFGLLLVVSPFVISSLLIDQRGVTISGRVRSKDERVMVHYSSWSRSQDVVIEYDPPDEASVAFLNAKVYPERFDELRVGDLVTLRYLRKEEIPQVPGAEVLRQMHLLPRVRLADQRAWSRLQMLFDARSIVVLKAVAGAPGAADRLANGSCSALRMGCCGLCTLRAYCS